MNKSVPIWMLSILAMVFGFASCDRYGNSKTFLWQTVCHSLILQRQWLLSTALQAKSPAFQMETGCV